MKSSQGRTLPTVHELAAIIALQQHISPVHIVGETRLTEDAGLDSLEMQNVLLTLEENYGIHLPPGALTDVVTVNDLAAAIVRAACAAGRDP